MTGAYVMYFVTSLISLIFNLILILLKNTWFIKRTDYIHGNDFPDY